MPSLAVIGAQWGDEGKGKLVDYLTSEADYVVRFQGGNNAGHTLVVDGVTTKLHLMPSGILHKKSICVIGAGVIVDTGVLAQEIAQLEQAGVAVTRERFLVDRDAHLIMPYHVAIDKAREELLGSEKIGTTGRGIGPTYEDRASRQGVRIGELEHLDRLLLRLEKVLEEKNKFLKHVLGSAQVIAFEQVESYLRQAAELLLPFLGNVSLEIHGALKADKRVVFEGAQGALLDQVHGTIPFVTSANTIAGAVTTGVGLGPKSINYVLGVTKAYCTRVGEGPFPTEMMDSFGDELRQKGGEFGTTTGRPRRCGWLDGVALRRAVRLNGVDSLAITKLDVLSGLETIRICVNYWLDGKKLNDVPSLAIDLERVEPEYVELSGWTEDLTSARKWHHLPASARLYLDTISEIAGTPVSIVSVGPERSSTIFSSGESFAKNFMGIIE